MQAAQRMHLSVCRSGSLARISDRPLSSRTTWKRCGPSPGVTPVQSDDDLRQRQAHASVTFRFDDDDPAGFGDEEICPADGGRHAQEFLPQEGPRRPGQFRGIVGQLRAIHFARENLAHLAAVHVQCGNHNMRGLILA
jgi:hypothetical protein